MTSRRRRPDPRLKRLKRRRAEAARAAANEVIRFLRTEQIGGLVLLGAAALALIVANSPFADQYHTLSSTVIGPHALHLDLSVADWAKDGLLTIFFVVAGLELKRELVVGELRNPRQAMLPIAGALGGMIIPAVTFLIVAWNNTGFAKGWAVPVATDIAFALAVLAITARSLPSSLRVFLLSLAIVDDLGAILLIAVVFTAHVAVLPLLGAAALIAGYGLLQRRRFVGWYVYLPIAVAAWMLVHASGVHATVAGVAVGLITRAKHDRDEQESPAERLEHRLQPISAGLCVPLFAFFAAGIAFDLEAITAVLGSRTALGVLIGLVVGKTIGVLGGSLIAVKTGLARLPAALSWHDMFAVAVLTGCGFTVSLLMTELAFSDRALQDQTKGAVLLGSLSASLIAAALLRRRVRVHNAT